jgi:hypothetical protein
VSVARAATRPQMTDTAEMAEMAEIAEMVEMPAPLRRAGADGGAPWTKCSGENTGRRA